MAILAIIGLIFVTNWGQNTPPNTAPQERPAFTQSGEVVR